jgi:hypothetical protein
LGWWVNFSYSRIRLIASRARTDWIIIVASFPDTSCLPLRMRSARRTRILANDLPHPLSLSRGEAPARAGGPSCRHVPYYDQTQQPQPATTAGCSGRLLRLRCIRRRNQGRQKRALLQWRPGRADATNERHRG